MLTLPRCIGRRRSRRRHRRRRPADEAHALGHQLPCASLFHAQDHRLGALDARPDRQLDVDLHFALVGLRLELEADVAEQHHRDREQREAGANTVGRCASARCSMRA